MKVRKLMLMWCLAPFGVLAQDAIRCLPVELKGIAIGMTWSNMVTSRPHALPLQWGPSEPKHRAVLEPDRPQRALTEELSGGLFSRALYGFDEGVLTSVMVGGSTKKGDGNRRKMLQHVLSKCGKPKEQTIDQLDKDGAVLVWEYENVLIRAVLPADDEVEKGAVSVQVMTKTVAESLRRMGEVDGSGLRERSSSHAERLTAFTNEVRRVLEEVNPGRQ